MVMCSISPISTKMEPRMQVGDRMGVWNRKHAGTLSVAISNFLRSGQATVIRDLLDYLGRLGVGLKEACDRTPG